MKMFQHHKTLVALLLCAGLLLSTAACSQQTEGTAPTAEPAVSTDLKVDEPATMPKEETPAAQETKEAEEEVAKLAQEKAEAEAKAAEEAAAKLAQEKAQAEAQAAKQAEQAQAAAQDAARQAEEARSSGRGITQSSSSSSTHTEFSGSLEESADTTAVTGELGQTAYWTPSGKSYHFSPNCTTLKRSKTILSGTLQEALDAKKTDPCNVCANG